MSGLPQDPKITILNLFEDNWDNTNTSLASDPVFNTGWVNRAIQTPQVTILEPQEVPSSGGTTGFRAIDPTGAGPIKSMLGRILVICWSDREMSSVNPKKLTWEMSEEVKRITKANLLSIGNGLEWVSWMGREERVDAGMEPPLFRYDNELNYYYFDRP